MDVFLPESMLSLQVSISQKGQNSLRFFIQFLGGDIEHVLEIRDLVKWGLIHCILHYHSKPNFLFFRIIYTANIDHQGTFFTDLKISRQL